MADQQTPRPENPEGEKQDNLQSEQEVAQQQQQALSQELLSEGQEATVLIRLAAGYFFYHAGKYNGIKNAFLTVADPNLAENLLDLAHPEKCIEVRASLKVTGEKLGEKGAGERGFAQARFLFWKSPAITQDRHDRVTLATVLAEKVQTSVNNRTTVIKTQTYIDRFHLSAEEAGAFSTKFTEWQKKNPHADIDNFLFVETRNVCRQRGEKFDRKEEIKKLEADWQKSVDEHKVFIEATDKVLKDYILNPDQPLLTPEQAQVKIAENILVPVAPLQAAPAPAPTTAPVQVPPAPSVAAPPVIQAAPQSILQPAGALQGISVPIPAGGITVPVNLFSGLRDRIHLPAGVTNFFGSIGNKLGSLFGGLGNRLGGALNKTNLAMTAAKEAIYAGLNALAPGLGPAVKKINDALRAVTGIDVMGTTVQLGIAVLIGIPVAIVFLPLLLNNSNALPYPGAENARVISLSENNRIGWNEFEEKFLTLTKQELNNQQLTTNNPQPTTVSWQQFTPAP